MGKIKILYTIPNFDTAGSGKALLNIAKGLDTSKFEPHIMCLHNRGKFFKEVEFSGIPVYIYPYLGRARPLWTLFKDCRKIASMFKEIAPNIIHSFNYSADYTEAIAARLAGIPWIFTKKNMSWGGSSKNGWLLRSSLAKKIVIQNTDMQALFYPGSKKTTLISRGVDTSRFISGEDTSPIRNQMHTKLGERIIICVANFVPVKGIELLIEAFEQLAKTYPNWVVWLVGDHSNEYGKMLQLLVEEKGLEHRVIFSGKQLNVLPFLHCAELFLLPTKGKGEGSPVALLEAMATGKCVIGSNVPGIKDQLSTFDNHLFEAGNLKSLILRLKYFMDQDQAALKNLGDQFASFTRTHFDVRTEINKHEQLYLSIQ